MGNRYFSVVNVVTLNQ